MTGILTIDKESEAWISQNVEAEDWQYLWGVLWGDSRYMRVIISAMREEGINDFEVFEL